MEQLTFFEVAQICLHNPSSNVADTNSNAYVLKMDAKPWGMYFKVTCDIFLFSTIKKYVAFWKRIILKSSKQKKRWEGLKGIK